MHNCCNNRYFLTFKLTCTWIPTVKICKIWIYILRDWIFHLKCIAKIHNFCSFWVNRVFCGSFFFFGNILFQLYLMDFLFWKGYVGGELSFGSFRNLISWNSYFVFWLFYTGCGTWVILSSCLCLLFPISFCNFKRFFFLHIS